jgi:S1-C subfamily serine protease
LIGAITRSVAAAESPPEYIKVEAPQPQAGSGGGGGGRRVYFGTIPDMTETGGGGVTLSGVATDGPADTAGLTEGDIIVELAGQPIDTLYDYQRVMDGLKVGEEVTIAVLRDGERLELRITPSSRE